MNLDLDFVRRQYPADHWHCVFFENAGGAFVPNAVIDRISAYMGQTQVQPGYPSAISTAAAERMNLGHCLMAEMIGADVDEVTIAASTSINVYVLAQALRHQWNTGDEIIVSTLNHEANSGPWRRLVEFGLNIVEWPITANGSLDMLALDSLLNEKTRLVAFPHVSNITGEINDIITVTQKAHDAGALVCVDGVACAPHRAVEVKNWDVDFYLFSFYKVFGPHMGCLYGKREHLLRAKGQGHYFFPEDDLLHKLNPAGPNHESIAALAGIADYFESLAAHHFAAPADTFFGRTQDLYNLFAQHEESLARQFLDYLNNRADISLIGPACYEMEIRVPTFSFQVEGVKSSTIPTALAADNIAIGDGHFYAKRMLDSLGLLQTDDGVVRCSMAHYNTADEVSQLINSLEKHLP